MRSTNLDRSFFGHLDFSYTHTHEIRLPRETTDLLKGIYLYSILTFVAVMGIALLLNARIPSNQSTQTKPNQIKF